MDVTRLTEMNAMLKEEMRRQERSEEREKHMHNLEYMKNIIFKVSSRACAEQKVVICRTKGHKLSSAQ